MADSDKKDLYIMGQGTYGCVYRPNIDCQTKKIDSKQFLSKIQRKDKTSKNEIVIGKKIISLPKNIYSNRFAPILESCPIEIGKMEEQQFSTCKMIVQGKEKIKKTGLLSNKIQYVGEQTLGDYLESEFLEEQITAIDDINVIISKLILIGNDGHGLWNFDATLLKK